MGCVDWPFYNLCQNIYGSSALANPVSLSSSMARSFAASPTSSALCNPPATTTISIPTPKPDDTQKIAGQQGRSDLRAPGSKEEVRFNCTKVPRHQQSELLPLCCLCTIWSKVFLWMNQNWLLPLVGDKIFTLWRFCSLFASSGGCLRVIFNPYAWGFCWVADLRIKQLVKRESHRLCCYTYFRPPPSGNHDPEDCAHHGVLLGNWPGLGRQHRQGWKEKVHG